MSLNSSYCEPTGTITSSEDLFLEGGPEFWLGGDYQNYPDTDGFYWG